MLNSKNNLSIVNAYRLSLSIPKGLVNEKPMARQKVHCP